MLGPGRAEREESPDPLGELAPAQMLHGLMLGRSLFLRDSGSHAGEETNYAKKRTALRRIMNMNGTLST